MDLIKHFTQAKVEPVTAPAPVPPLRSATPQPLPPHLIEGNGNEPRMYSVRKMLENLPPDSSPVVQPPDQFAAPMTNPGSDSSSERPAGLAGAVLSYVEHDGAAGYQVFQAVAKLFE
jgi:hypothetical protein